MRIENPFIRFLFVGVINTVVGYTLFIICRWIGMPRAWAVLTSTVLGVTFNYHSTGKIVFQNKGYNVIVQFFVVYGIMYVINLLELHLLDISGLYEWIISLDGKHLNIVESFSLNHDKVGDAIGQLIVVLPNAIMTFLLNRTFVFRKNKA
ncbi:MAG: GtrA family protein [Bacteroidales bacterium]|nr:GtrA family protein [Bacteroidales bacterium]MBQ7985270.1 GtrA family protein [Bacteroidales bacterium]